MVVDMNEESAENGDDPIRWLMARIFCDTRFSQSEQGVYNVVIRMFRVRLWTQRVWRHAS